MSIAHSLFRSHVVLLSGAVLAVRAGVGLAVPFGDTVTSNAIFLHPCVDTTVASLPVTVDVPSRLFVNATAPFSDNGNPAYNSGSYQVVLRDSGDTTTLASIPGTNFYEPDATSNTLIASGVLFQGTNGTTAFTVAPGIYLLKFTVNVNGTCGATGGIVTSSTLTYLMLSSVLDRIFASGFNAMVFAENHETLPA